MSDRNRDHDETERHTDAERSVMGDPHTIRTWGEERDAVPVYYSDEDRYDLMHRDETTDDHTTHTWDEFSNRFGDRDEVLVYGSDESGGLGSAQFVDREDAITRATLDDDEVQEALLDGETVTTQFEEEVVVEKRVTERETIESELVAREEVDRRVTERDLVGRRIVDVDVGHIDIRDELVGRDFGGKSTTSTLEDDTRHTDETRDTEDGIVGTGGNENDSVVSTEGTEDEGIVGNDHNTDRDRGHGTTDRDRSHETTDLDRDDHEVEDDTIDVEIEEDWRVTEEVVERMTIESRVVDDTITEDESVESQSTETSIDVEGVHRSLASQGFLGSNANADDIVGSDTIRSEVLDDEEGRVVRSQLFQRKLIDNDMVERKTLTYDLSRTTEVSEETTTSTERDAEIVDLSLDEEGRYGDYEYDLSDSTVDRGRVDPTADAVSDTDASDTATTATTATTADGDHQIDPSDRGKKVVDEDRNEIGIVDEVDEDGDRLYVDPDPGMFDKVKAELGWGSKDDDDYVITSNQIAGRDGSQIVVREA